MRGLSAQRAAQAVCLVVRNQHADIREWLEHHMALGVGRFYVFDNNSTRPMLDTVLDLVQAGVVDYQYLTGYQHHSNRRARSRPDRCPIARSLMAVLWQGATVGVQEVRSRPACCLMRAFMAVLWQGATVGLRGAPAGPRRRTQLYVYDTCIQQYRARHHWMAFIDADEFFVLRDARVPDLPALLAEYEHFGALAVNWQARRPGRPERLSSCGCAGSPRVLLAASAEQLAARDP